MGTSIKLPLGSTRKQINALCRKYSQVAFRKMTMATVTSSEPAATSIKAQDPHFISFMATFDKIMVDLEEILSKMNVPEQGLKWFKNMFKETCVGGKMNRGLTVPSALRSILKRELSEKELFDSQVLGWLIEMVIVVYKLQAFFLIQDDIMDASITRRGKPCWYKRENVGMIAINDSIMIEMCIYQLLKHHFKSHPAYVEMMELFHDTTFQTEVGQMMDLLTAPENNVDLSKFSISRFKLIKIDMRI